MSHQRKVPNPIYKLMKRSILQKILHNGKKHEITRLTGSSWKACICIYVQNMFVGRPCKLGESHGEGSLPQVMTYMRTNYTAV